MAKRAASSQLSDLSLDALAHELCFFKALVRPGPHEASPVKHVPCLQEALMCVLNAAGWEGSHELCFRVALRNNLRELRDSVDGKFVLNPSLESRKCHPDPQAAVFRSLRRRDLLLKSKI